jgi:hypothetical protein
MGRLILSEDATIELDGKKITLKEGDSVQVNRSLFKVDSEFEVNTEKGRMLIEPGDSIQVGGQYKALSSTEFTSDGKKFSLEKGEKFDVITPTTEDIDVVEEGVWDEIKRGFLGQDTAAEAVAQILGKLLKLGRIIVAKAERVEKETGNNPYLKLFASKEMETLNELLKLNKEGLGGERVSVGDVVDILDLDDPTELINRIRDELVRIGDTRLARRIEEMIPKGFFGKINQVWKNIRGQKMAKGEISTRAENAQTQQSDPGIDKAISAAKQKIGKPEKQEIYTKSDPIRLQKIWDYAKKVGNIQKVLEHFGNKTNEKEVKQAIKYGSSKSKAPFAKKVDKAVNEVIPTRSKGKKKKIPAKSSTIKSRPAVKIAKPPQKKATAKQ